MLDAELVRHSITEFFHDRGGRIPTQGPLPDDFDVIVDGGLDSLGFLELISRLESDFDAELDLSRFASEALTRVSTLVRATSD